jgi:hypothetical protein
MISNIFLFAVEYSRHTSFTIKLLAFLKCFFAARFLTAFRKKSKTVHDQTLFSSAFFQHAFYSIDHEHLDGFFAAIF